MQCDMCGKDSENLNIAKVEGVEMNVCQDCTKYGQFVRRVRTQQKVKQKINRPIQIVNKNERVLLIKDDFGNIIKNAREKKGLTQEEVAKTLKEKESLIQKIESGKKEPNMTIARKFEKFLRIKIVEETAVNQNEHKRNSKTSGPLTIGDMIKLIPK